MLIEFKAGNFRSLCEPAVLSMVASHLTARNKGLDRDNVVPVHDELALLKTAAIYGPNAGGKSNLVRALRFMRDFVLESSRETQAGDLIPVEPFLLREDMISVPSSFEIVFELKGVQYRYGFELDAQHVHAEWLFSRQSTRERTLFERVFQDVTLGPGFRKEGKGLDERTRPNALFLSVAAQWNGSLSTELIRWFQQFQILIGDHSRNQETLAQLQAEGPEKTAIDRLVKSLDLGIEQIFVVETQQDAVEANESSEARTSFRRMGRPPTVPVYSIGTLHRRLTVDGEIKDYMLFDLERHESDGTQRLFALAGVILGALRRGDLLVVDELDMRLHPLMTCELIRLFHDRETNPHNAQLVFTTHDTNLLGIDLFRRDQVWFAEKDRMGATHLYSLAEFKVRSDASFEKDYVRGKFGAIPFLGGLRSVVDEAIKTGEADEAADG